MDIQLSRSYLGLNLKLYFVFRSSLEVHKRQARTFYGIFCITYLCSCLIYASHYLSQLKNNQGQNFLDQILISLFHIYHIYWIWDIRNLNKYQELQEIVAGGQKLKLFNYQKLQSGQPYKRKCYQLVFLSCFLPLQALVYKEESNEMKVSLETHQLVDECHSLMN